MLISSRLQYQQMISRFSRGMQAVLKNSSFIIADITGSVVVLYVSVIKDRIVVGTLLVIRAAHGAGFTLKMTGNVLGSEVKAAAWLWKGSECQEEREDRDKVSQSQSPRESAPSCISKEACGF